MEKYKLSNGKTAEVDNARGVSGCLLRGLDNEIWFRVYNEDNTYQDYPIRHHDLEIIITGEASFYRTEDGKIYLDHSPATLGYKKE